MRKPCLAMLLIAAGLCAAQEPEIERAHVNGTELAYVERGQGEPVVLIHGFMWDYRVREGPIAELSRKYRVIAYSRRHHWPNPEPGERFNPSMVTQAEDLAALLKRRRPFALAHTSAGYA